MPISNKQLKILAFPYTQKYQSLICDGAVRSGKTSIMTVSFVDWAMREFNNTNFGICGKTVGSAIKNIINPYLSLAYHGNKYSISFTRSDNKMVVKQGNKTNTFYIYGGKDESSYMLIQGITLAGVLFDEVALMTRSFVEQALARCLSYPNRRYWFNCNPENPNHWFYTEWIQKADKHNALHLHFLMTDNPALDEKTIEEAKLMYSGVFYDRYILGKWVLAEGLVYPMFNPTTHVVKTEDRAYTRYVVSNDYGTKHPCIFHLYGFCDGMWYLVKEYHYDGSKNPQKTVEQYYNDFLEFIGEKTIEKLYLDNAPIAASFNIHLAQKCTFKYTMSDNAVEKGIQSVSSALSNGLIKINDCCTNTIREFGLYSWDKKSTEDKVIKDNDDNMDCLRYFVQSHKITVQKRQSLFDIMRR